jgi:hypothetical protein
MQHDTAETCRLFPERLGGPDGCGHWRRHIFTVVGIGAVIFSAVSLVLEVLLSLHFNN